MSTGSKTGVLVWLKSWFGAVPGSLQGLLSAEERIRAIVVALASGKVAAAVVLVLGLVGLDLPPDGVLVVTAFFVALWDLCVYIAEAARRKSHGLSGPVPASAHPQLDLAALDFDDFASGLDDDDEDDDFDDDDDDFDDFDDDDLDDDDEDTDDDEDFPESRPVGPFARH